jgi:site-specific DNA-cytosine methylase
MSYVDTAFKSPVVISLCPGIRGLERGIERALGTKLRVAAYVEIEAFIIANLLAGMEEGLVDAAPIWSNLKTFDAKPFRGKIHGIIGGYPCQPFSDAGLRKGTADPRHLYPFISRCIKKSRPLWCLFENVEGHLSLGFDIVQKDLRKMGYAVEAGVYSAEEVEAPHRRNRLFILALENSFRQRMRGRIIENKTCSRNRSEIQTQGPSELADAGLQRSPQREEQSNRVEQCCQMVNPDNESLDSSIGGILPEPSGAGVSMGNANDARLQRRLCGKCGECSGQWAVGSHGPCDPTGNMANANDERCEAQRDNKESFEEEHARASRNGSFDRWPSGPGRAQQEWEEPRIIEPGMGCTVDGYNFREDFLRALGNSVVEQTAELAFIDLIRKHGIKI